MRIRESSIPERSLHADESPAYPKLNINSCSVAGFFLRVILLFLQRMVEQGVCWGLSYIYVKTTA